MLELANPDFPFASLIAVVMDMFFAHDPLIANMTIIVIVARCPLRDFFLSKTNPGVDVNNVIYSRYQLPTFPSVLYMF